MQKNRFLLACTATVAALLPLALAAPGLAATAPLMLLTQCEDAGDYKLTMSLKAERSLTLTEGTIDFARSTNGPAFKEVQRKSLKMGESYEFKTGIPETMPLVQICADPGGSMKKCWEPMWSQADDADGFPTMQTGFALATALKKDWISGWLGRYQWTDKAGRQYALTLRRDACRPGAWMEAAGDDFLATFQGDRDRVAVYRVDVNNGHKPTERLFTLKREGGELTTEWAGMRPAGTDESGRFFAPAR